MRPRLVALALVLVGAALSAQAPVRRATNIAALQAFPTFFHGHQVLVVGDLVTGDDGKTRASDGSLSLNVIARSGGAPGGSHEIRGEFWDLGRMNPDDPRLANLDLRKLFGIDPEGAWPRAGEATALMATGFTPANVAPAPSIRAIVLAPQRYQDQKVTVSGQFTGRNLMGHLPDAPARSRWDFVIRSADAALWVSGARPKGKGFDLALDARLDTGRWIEVTGVVKEGRGLQWIETTEDGIRLGTAPAETPRADEPPAVRAPSAPAPEVVFSAPTQEESDVAPTSSVRVQFTRDIKVSTLRGNVRVAYLESETVERGEPTTPAAEFTTQYNAANRVLELKFAKPLERFRTVTVELKDGILGTDDQPLKPYTLRFVVGAS